MSYRILKADNIEELEEKVRNVAQAEYYPIGGPLWIPPAHSMERGCVAQAVVCTALQGGETEFIAVNSPEEVVALVEALQGGEKDD